jgi:hypothetical protein
MNGVGRSKREGRNFKRDASGRLLYFPFGTLSYGRIVPASCELKIKSLAVASYVAQFVSIILYVSLVWNSTSYYLDVTLFLTVILFYIIPYIAALGMELTAQHISHEEMRNSLPLGQLLLEGLLSLILGTVFCLKDASRNGAIHSAVFVTVITVALLSVYWPRFRSLSGLPHPE